MNLLAIHALFIYHDRLVPCTQVILCIEDVPNEEILNRNGLAIVEYCFWKLHCNVTNL